MSNREHVLQRLEKAVAGLEAAAERRLSMPSPESAAPENGPQDDGTKEKLAAVIEERDRLSEQVKEQANHNADLGARLDKAIAKLNKVLEKA